MPRMWACELEGRAEVMGASVRVDAARIVPQPTLLPGQPDAGPLCPLSSSITTGVWAEGKWRMRHFGQHDPQPDVKSFQHIHVDAGYRAKGSSPAALSHTHDPSLALLYILSELERGGGFQRLSRQPSR